MIRRNTLWLNGMFCRFFCGACAAQISVLPCPEAVTVQVQCVIIRTECQTPVRQTGRKCSRHVAPTHLIAGAADSFHTGCIRGT